MQELRQIFLGFEKRVIIERKKYMFFLFRNEVFACKLQNTRDLMVEAIRCQNQRSCDHNKI